MGIVASLVREEEKQVGKQCRISIQEESDLSVPEFISPTDSLYNSFSAYFRFCKKKNDHTSAHVSTRTLQGSAYFVFRYELGSHSIVDGDEVLVSGGSVDNIKLGIEYFRFGGFPISKYSVENGMIGIQFYYCQGFDNYEVLEGAAYDFGRELDFWLMNNGYEVHVYPNFISSYYTEQEIKDDNDAAGGGGGGGTPSGGSSGGSSGSSCISLPPLSVIIEKFNVVAKMEPIDVANLIGGNVLTNYLGNPGAFFNGCVVRLSYALNMCGGNHKIPFFNEDQTISGDANHDGAKEWYYFRVAEIIPYLDGKYGAHQTVTLEDIKGKTGIIGQTDCGWGVEDT